MNIGINLVGISYNDGYKGRYRNYEDAIDGLMNHIVNPLKDEGHDIKFYIYTYDNIKRDNILKAYTPIQKYYFTNSEYNIRFRNDMVSNGMKLMSSTYIMSLEQLKNECLDLVISTRFDINFLKNPFKEYSYDFTKFNFLWREPEYTELPIVNDTFVVFPYKMLNDVIESIVEMEINPPHNINIAMHNWYLPMINRVGKDNVKWLDDRYVTHVENNLYKLTRHE